ncbi:organic cation transporter protein-like isoform X1 [Styela clava]
MHAEEEIISVKLNISKKDKDGIEFDDFLLDELGGMSRYQLLSVFATTVQVFCAFSTTTLPFYLSATPKFRCASPFDEDFIGQNNVSDEFLRSIRPSTSSQNYNSCHERLYNYSLCNGNWNTSCLKNQTDAPLVKCDKYVYDDDVYKSSITTEWDLVCNRAVMKTIANSSMFFGFLIGAIISGIVTDRIGRKMTMLLICILSSSSGFAFAFSQSYHVYIVFFILFSIGISGQYIVTFTYMSEISCKKGRGKLIFTVSLLAIIGDILISLVAVIYRNWRYIAIYSVVINLLYLPVHFFISESPRWLLSIGRTEKARKVVMKYFKSSGKNFNEEKWQSVLKSFESQRSEDEVQSKTYSFIDLYRFPHVRIISMNVMFSWMVISLVYYGLILNTGYLAGNPYVNGLVNSTLDFIATIAALIGERYCSKVYLLSGSYAIAGISCILSMLVLDFGYATASVVFACVGRLGAASVYKIIYVVTPELFPTLLRGTGMSICTGTSRIGGMISPFIVQSQEVIPWLMQSIFGVLSIVAGFLGLIFPDTKNVALVATPEDAEDFFKDNMALIYRRRNPKRHRKFTYPRLRSNNSNLVEDVKLSECDQVEEP